MTDKEIAQALHICGEGHPCRDCQLYGKEISCVETLCKYALALIERLTAENAALREKVPRWISVDISIRTPAWGVTAKIHKTVFNHLYIFAALCAFCSEITQQKAIIIRILKENTSIHCADLPENYARL